MEYLIAFVGYGPGHNLWQDDVENCEQLVEDQWASKPESERLVVMLLPRTCMALAVASVACRPMLHAIVALCHLDDEFLCNPFCLLHFLERRLHESDHSCNVT